MVSACPRSLARACLALADGYAPICPPARPPDYLLYGRVYIPTGRLDALYSTRLSPTLQALVAAISDPRADLTQSRFSRNGASPSNVMLNLQHDTGRWCTEYTYSAEDSMLGVRVLHNFGRLGAPADSAEESERARDKRIDEEDAMEGGLKGRISVGAEVYFSAKERSAGGKSRHLPLSRTPIELQTLILRSLHRHPLHDLPRRDAALLPAPPRIPTLAHPTPAPARIPLAAAHDDHGPLQPHDGPHVRRVRRARLARPLPLLPLRLQRLQLRERVDDGRRVVAPPLKVKVPGQRRRRARPGLPRARSGRALVRRRDHGRRQSARIDLQRKSPFSLHA